MKTSAGTLRSLVNRTISLVLFLGLLSVSDALPRQASDGNAVLRKADENRVSGNKVVESEMVIHGTRVSRSIRSKSWIEGTERSYTEYLDPPRERGIKMLKIGDQLWTYYPSTDRTILISGHMLRQSVMGSDLSYEDAMEDPRLANIYGAVSAGEDTVLGRPCWRLELTARVPGTAYHSRRVWVDRERFVILKEERYARAGRLLKTAEVLSVLQVQGRWIPDRAVFRDVLKDGKGTEFILRSIEFDAEIPDHVFSKASLKR